MQIRLRSEVNAGIVHAGACAGLIDLIFAVVGETNAKYHSPFPGDSGPSLSIRDISGFAACLVR